MSDYNWDISHRAILVEDKQMDDVSELLQWFLSKDSVFLRDLLNSNYVPGCVETGSSEWGFPYSVLDEVDTLTVRSFTFALVKK